MSQKRRVGGFSLLSSAPNAADSESDSSEDAPVPQQLKRRSRAPAASDSESRQSSDEEYNSSDVESGSDEASDESLEELQKELEQIPFEELREMQKQEGGGLRKKQKSAATSSLSNEKQSKSKKADDQSKLSRRQSKNAPIVVSSKAPPSRRPKIVVPIKKAETRDPRFDSLSGKFNEETFKRSYAFIDQIKGNEIKQLKDAIKKEKNYQEKRRLREALQILKNRQQAEQDKQKRREILRQHKKQERERVQQGKNPFFLKKKQLKEMELQQKYEELKQKGGEAEVDRYLRDKRKRKAQKEHRFVPFKRRAVEGDDGTPTPAFE